MKKTIAIISILLIFNALKAQEVLLPLSSNARLKTLSEAKNVVRQKRTTAPLQLPFFDDFSNYTGYPDTTKWLENQTFVNADYAVFPPTIGVVTLDAIDGNGALYAGISTSSTPADTLTSRQIRLDSAFSPYPKKLTPADSIYLSFYYQPGGGYGDVWQHVGSAPS